MAQLFLLGGISLPVSQPEEAFAEKARRFVQERIPGAHVESTKIYKRSLDCRKAPQIQRVCTVLAEVACTKEQAQRLLHAEGNVRLFSEDTLRISRGTEKAAGRVAVIGFGPCGMFAALLLSEAGYAPIVFERGDDVAQRIQAVSLFREQHRLNLRSNIQFGAGGAGTFSDGKLTTRIHDPKCRYVLRRFVDFGADPDILIDAKPHLGTDVLPGIVSNLRDAVKRHGGEFHFTTTVKAFSKNTDGALVLHTDRGDFACGAAVFAPGHSARDTYRMLLDNAYPLIPKPFSVGVRIEHLQSDINQMIYKGAQERESLPPAEYALSMREGARGVYSFCMCPGGEVVGAASEEGGVVVNGMSNSLRDGRNANAALAVSVLPEDFSADCRRAIEFQRTLEQAAFAAGGKSYACPLQTVGDFLADTSQAEPSRVLPTYLGGFYKTCNLKTVLPPFVTMMLSSGIRFFGRRYSGFDMPQALLCAVESRTSAPLRILRTEQGYIPGHDLLYPAGEGAGYAGGITSAACDGLTAALSLMARFAPPQEKELG